MLSPDAVLRCFATLAPSRQAMDERVVWDVRADGPVSLAGSNLDAWRGHVLMRGEERVGRTAPLSLVGTGPVAGRTRTVVAPLVRAEIDIGGAERIGDLEVSPVAERLGLPTGPLVDLARQAHVPPDDGPQLLEDLPGVAAVREALRDAGVDVAGVRRGRSHEDVPTDGLWLQLGYLDHVVADPEPPPRVESLLGWAERPLQGTALDALYGDVRDDDVDAEELGDEAEPLVNPLPLTAAQRDVVRAARARRLSVVSGAPGTGKSHVAVAIALDALAGGRSVLLATRSRHAADVLADLLARQPGPAPLRIGGGTTARALADELAAGTDRAPGRAAVTASVAAVEAARDRLRDAHEVLAAALRVAGTGAGGTAGEALQRVDVPGAFDGTVERADAERLLARASRTTGVLARWRADRAGRRLRASLRSAPDVPLSRIRDALSTARVRALADQLSVTGRLDPAPLREARAMAAAALRTAAGAHLAMVTAGAGSRAGRTAVAALSAALRASAGRRAELLERIEADALTTAVPLWVGTVAEVERMLPRVPGLFDVVVLDEASQLDQLVAAPVLARARSAVVVGDPRQLRHVSFVADVDVDAALTQHGLVEEPRAGVLDVRRVSTFDAAAAAEPVRWLDEHLRSDPHLIGFSAERFYAGRLHVTTVHPSVARSDAIDTVHVEGAAGDDGVVVSELDGAVAFLGDGLPPGMDIGFVSPFRDVADALESRLLSEVPYEVLRERRARVGTVHGFQGGERDVVVVVLGLVEDGPSQRRRFAEDPHLFNVMVTRARRRVVVVTALPVGTGGLVGDYLRHAETPPAPAEPPAPTDPWTRALLAECLRNGLDVRPGPRVGRAEVDLVGGRGGDAVALLTRPHPDGTVADVDRYDALVRAGWQVREEYATPTDADPVTRALLLRGDRVGVTERA